MAFDVNTITVQGAIAIASATAGNKLVIDGCDAVTGIYTQAQAVQIASRPATPDSTTTSIALAGSTENHVYAYASFIQGETGQPGGDVHSFLLYGHSENTPNVVVVVAVASSTEPVHLPEPGDVTNRTEVQFELSFSATDEVVTVAGTSMYTTRGEFLLLKNRTVTTHAEGETTVGDDQTIYGDKTFADGLAISTLSGIGTNPITLASSVIPSGISAKLGAGDHMFSEAFVHYITGVADATHGTCYSYCGSGGVGSTYSMNWYVQSEHKGLEAKIYLSTEDESGTAKKEVAGIRLRDSFSTKAQMELSYDKAQDKAVITFTGDVSFANTASTPSLYADSISSYAADYVELDMSIFPESNDVTLGLASDPFNASYIRTLNVASIQTLTSGQVITVDTLVPNGGNAALGSNSFPFLNVYAESVECGEILPSDAISDIGTSVNRFRNVYANNLDGVLVHPTASNADPPVGSIVFIAVMDTSPFSIGVGDSIRSGTGYYQHINYASWDNDGGSWGAGADVSTSSVFRALSEGTTNGFSPYMTYVLAIRVQ